MKRRCLIFLIVALISLCGCNQNPQTITTIPPTAESDITGQVTAGLSEAKNGDVESTHEPKVTAQLTLTSEPVETITPLLTTEPSEPATPLPAPEPTAAISPGPELEPTAAIAFIPEPTAMPDLTPTSLPEPTKAVEPTTTVTPTSIPTPTVNPLEGAFWRELYREDTEVRRTLQEISLLNEQNFRNKETNLVKLSGMSDVKASTVIKMIESYSFPNYKYYGNEKISIETKQEILNKRNLGTLQEQEDAELRFGILIQNTDLRSFPADKPLTSEKNGRYDYLQETVLYLNEAVVILHTSSDGKWCFVQAENYYGWIREESVAYCDEEIMKKHYDALLDTDNKNILLVIKNGTYEPNFGAKYSLRMGTKLFCDTNEAGKLVVCIPVRTEEKQLAVIQYPVFCVKDDEKLFHQGYLPYTKSNVITLATDLLDTVYAWGDSLPYKEFYSYKSDNGMDCSSTMVAVYRCFGFVMPRNTGTQRAMAWESDAVKGVQTSQKKEVLSGTEAGALLYSPGHVMLYLGEYNGEYYVLHNTTTEFLSDGTEKSYYRCVISSMSLGKKGKTLMEQLLEIKTFIKKERCERQ